MMQRSGLSNGTPDNAACVFAFMHLLHLPAPPVRKIFFGVYAVDMIEFLQSVDEEYADVLINFRANDRCNVSRRDQIAKAFASVEKASAKKAALRK